MQPVVANNLWNTPARAALSSARKVIMPVPSSNNAGSKDFPSAELRFPKNMSGFIINTGNATTDDIRALIAHIQNCVLHNFGVLLEPEVQLIGRT